MSDIENIIEGNSSPPLEAIRNFSNPEKLAQHFRDMKTIITQYVAVTREVPEDFAEMHIILSRFEDHFLSLAIQKKYLSNTMPLAN